MRHKQSLRPGKCAYSIYGRTSKAGRNIENDADFQTEDSKWRVRPVMVIGG